MAWLPSHQSLREHPKVRKAALVLGVPRAQLIGHLHCLWWWAFDYAPDGNVSHFDDTDLALAADWEGDPAEFVAALVGCGAGARAGFIENGQLHDWDEYAGKYIEQRQREADRKRNLRASGGRPPDGGSASAGQDGDVRGTADVEEIEEIEEKDSGVAPAPAKRKSRLPDGWEPKDSHTLLARQCGTTVSAQVDQFRDYHRAKGSTMADWDLTFNTWLRNSQKFGGAVSGDTVRYR